MNKIKTAVIGAAGYTGGELVRLLLHHPNVALEWIHSNSQKGKPLADVHADLIGESDLIFTENIQAEGLDVVFLCLPHGEARPFINANNFDANTVIIDLSTDFRDESNGFVYGLPEMNREKLKTAKKIANPGCFATGIQLALLQAIAGKHVHQPIHIAGITGSTGAGKKLSETTHFSQRNQNVSVYKLFTHQHLREIKQTFEQLHHGFAQELFFVPFRGNFSRGIWVTAYFPYEGSLESAYRIYEKYYETSPFTFVSKRDIDLKQAVNSNKCLVHLKKEAGQLVVHSAIDNLLKGASGQAVQNMNLAFGLPENAGLQLKSTAF